MRRFAPSLALLLALALPVRAHDFTDPNVKDLQNAVEIWFGPEQIYVDYWFLFGEIEALGYRQQMDGADKDGVISPAERQAWLDVRKSRLLDTGLMADLDEKQVQFTLLSEPLLDTTVDVVGAVPFKLSFELSLPTKALAPGEHTFQFAAMNIQRRPARQVLMVTTDQCEILAGIPDDAQKFPAGKKPYPSAPDQVRSVFQLQGDLPGAQVGREIYLRFRKPQSYLPPTDPRTGRTAPGESDKGQESMLKSLTQRGLTLPLVIGALALAFFWGMLHGLAPGHGKTIAAAYLVGSRGTVLNAVMLGLVVTVTHLASVVVMCIALNLAIEKAQGTSVRNQVNFWSGIASGGITFLVGVGLLATRFPAKRHDHDHGHDHGPDHDHGPEHEGEEHDHGHSHVPAGDGPVGLWSIVSLGISGGIVPCPTAWVLLLLSIHERVFAWGLLLILAFSLGLALTLVGIGILFVGGKRLLDRVSFGESLLRVGLVVSPLLIMGIGVFMIWNVIAWRSSL